MATHAKPVGSVLPDIRGRVSLTKYLPPAPPLYLVFKEPKSGTITLVPAHTTGDEAA